jgi:hypothetical protein
MKLLLDENSERLGTLGLSRLQYTTTASEKRPWPEGVSNGSIPDLLDFEMFCATFKLPASATLMPETSK